MTITAPSAAGDWSEIAANGSFNSRVISAPANAVVGEGFMIFAQFRNAGGTLSITPSTGWTILGPVSNANQSAQIAVRTMTSGDIGASWTVTTTASSNRALILGRRVLGADLSSAVIGSLSTPAAESTLTIPGVTTAADNSGVFLVGAAQNASTTGVTFTPPSPYDSFSRFVNNGSSSSASFIGFATKATAGDTGPIAVAMASGTTPAASADQGWAVAFSPIVVGPPPGIPSNVYVKNSTAWNKRTVYVRESSGWKAMQ